MTPATGADIAVVGGGPAGASAAITLARAGRDVVLVDKASFPRDKICGDGLTTGALRLLEELGLDPATVPSWRPTGHIVVRGPSGREVDYLLPTGRGAFAVAAERYELDIALLDVARTAGVHVLDGTAVTGVTVLDDRVVLATAAGTVEAGYAIAADGMWSPVRKALGLAIDGYLGDSHAFRQYFRDVGSRAAGELYVSFEADLLPGYLWSFPLGGGRANVGFGIHRGSGVTVRDMAALWPDLLRRPHVRAVLGPDAVAEGPHRAWPIPTAADRLPCSGGGGRVLFVGDAVGAVDPMSGEGIAQALDTGRWAAEAVLAAGPHSPVIAADRYRKRIRRELLPDHRMSGWLVDLLRSRRGADAAVAISAATPWTRRNFARWLFEDEPRGILLTPHRWHRHFLARPGSFDHAAEQAEGTIQPS